MPTPFESAQLILTLYEQRREPLMRKARDFMLGFDPQSFDDILAIMPKPESAYVRQVLGYWEMAASLVTNGAIDQKMFQDSTAEYIAVFAKIEPFLADFRERFGNPDFGIHLERLAMSLPNARERIDGTRERIKAMIAARAAAATATA